MDAEPLARHSADDEGFRPQMVHPLAGFDCHQPMTLQGDQQAVGGGPGQPRPLDQLGQAHAAPLSGGDQTKQGNCTVEALCARLLSLAHLFRAPSIKSRFCAVQ